LKSGRSAREEIYFLTRAHFITFFPDFVEHPLQRVVAARQRGILKADAGDIIRRVFQRRGAFAVMRARAMRYVITVHPSYLKADLHDRQTAEETREFLEAVAREGIRNEKWRVLVSVHDSAPIFTVEKYGLSSFIEVAQKYAERIALVADSREVRMAHEYAAVLVRLAGINVKTFREEAAAIAWLEEGAGTARMEPAPADDTEKRIVPR
jgi:hypothetical protein